MEIQPLFLYFVEFVMVLTLTSDVEFFPLRFDFSEQISCEGTCISGRLTVGLTWIKEEFFQDSSQIQFHFLTKNKQFF